MKNKPIKRHLSLQPVSRDHHQGLLLCWKIRKGFSKNVEINRIKKYADWFYQNHLLPHFELEERHIFPVLGNEHELVKKALADHRKLRKLFEDQEEVGKALSLIEEELEAHIRFEERVLFNELQETATTEALEEISRLHTDHQFVENATDTFWL